MQLARSYALIATAYWTISARALPYANPGPTYSVVDVGGPSSTDEGTTVYETVKVSQPAQTETQAAPAVTVTTTPEGPIIPHVEATTRVVSMTTTKAESVTLAVVAPSPTSHPASSSTSSTSASCASAGNTSSAVAAYTPAYTPSAYTSSAYTPSAVAHSSTSSAWSSTSTSTFLPTETAGYGFASPTGWAAPWNSTSGYVPQGYAVSSGILHSGYISRATPVAPGIAYVS